jgi:hypothetical protein
VTLGPLGYVLWFLRYLVPLTALLLVVDSLRRPAADFGGAGWRRWIWAVPQAALLLLTLAGWTITGIAARAGGVAITLVALCVPMQVVYLVKVAFPKQAHAREAPGGAGEGDGTPPDLAGGAPPGV